MSTPLRDPTELRQMLATALARELRIDPQRIDRDRPFTQYGLDSVAILTIACDLEDVLPFELDSTVLWDCPTVNLLAARLEELLRRQAGALA